MIIKSATFISSMVAMDKLPKPDRPEYAFIGRSNVGKSSLINMICGIKKLAKVSGSPGKTQTINHFLINNNWYLVDLPGYGYAKVSKSSRRTWEGFISEYLKNRSSLECIFVLIDSRLEPQKIDMEFMTWLGENNLPFAMVFTKCDKLGKVALQKNIADYKKEMLKTWAALPEIFLTSSSTQFGKLELLSYIGEINQTISSN